MNINTAINVSVLKHRNNSRKGGSAIDGPRAPFATRETVQNRQRIAEMHYVSGPTDGNGRYRKAALAW